MNEVDSLPQDVQGPIVTVHNQNFVQIKNRQHQSILKQQPNKKKYQRFKAFQKKTDNQKIYDDFAKNINDDTYSNKQSNNNISISSQYKSQPQNQSKQSYFNNNNNSTQDKQKKVSKNKSISNLTFKKKVTVQQNLFKHCPQIKILNEAGKIMPILKNDKKGSQQQKQIANVTFNFLKSILGQYNQPIDKKSNNKKNNDKKRQRRCSFNILKSSYQIQEVKLKRITQKSFQKQNTSKSQQKQKIQQFSQFCQTCGKNLNQQIKISNNISKQIQNKLKNMQKSVLDLQQIYRKLVTDFILWRCQFENKISQIIKSPQTIVQSKCTEETMNERINTKQFNQLINKNSKQTNKIQIQSQFKDNFYKKIKKDKKCNEDKNILFDLQSKNDEYVNQKFDRISSTQKLTKEEYLSSVDNRSQVSEFSMKSIGKIIKNYKFDKTKQLIFQLDLKNEIFNDIGSQNKRNVFAPLTARQSNESAKYQFFDLNWQNKFQQQRKIGKIKKVLRYDTPVQKINPLRKMSNSNYTQRRKSNSNKKQAQNSFMNILQTLKNMEQTLK